MILRDLNYILSRCETEEDVHYVMEQLRSYNVILLIQLLIQYANYQEDGERTFRFVKHGMLQSHSETEDEQGRRRSFVGKDVRDEVVAMIHSDLETTLKGRLGKVYIDPAMEKCALPLQGMTSSGGYGVLSTGTRIPFPEGKKIRAFIYWEKTDDIDLSVIGIRKDGTQKEFSWRTMAERQSDVITFSGDITDGYRRASEYFDIDPLGFAQVEPDIQYLVFCDNIFEGCDRFDECECTAGYMLRDKEDSGKVFEPKTVKSSFPIKGDSSFKYLFGIDLAANEFVWLNITSGNTVRVAGTKRFDFLMDYFHMTETINLYSFFSMMAEELVDDPNEADIIVSDEDIESEAEIVRSCDQEKILAFLNQKQKNN